MDLHGVYVPLVTPFDERGEVAAGALARLAGEVLGEGAAGLVALGTTGEAATLDPAERRLVVDVCAGVAGERGVPLIIGAGGSDTRAAAAELGGLAGRPEVTAALVAVPPYLRPGPAGAVAHLTALAEASPVPLVAYHVPYRTAQDLPLPALRQLAAHPRIAGVKYATGALDATAVALLAEPVPGFAVLAGDDVFAAPMLALGAPGAILASAHLHTGRFVAMAGAWRAGQAARARALGGALAGLSAALFAAPSPTVLKAVLHAAGRIPTPAVRLPLLPPPPEQVAAALERVAALPAGVSAGRGTG